MKVNGILSSIKTTMFGLSTQLRRMDAISENIANAEKLPDENGNVYQRKYVMVEERGNSAVRRFSDFLNLKLRRSQPEHISQPAANRISAKAGSGSEQSVEIVEQNGQKLVYDPRHPQADDNGYVKMPDVNLVEEMIDLISASRVYEANVTVINAAKQMAKRSLDI